MREAEEAAFARGVAVEALMDQAGAGVARAVQEFFPKPGTCLVFAGPGHNGGDALVAAKCLKQGGWEIDARVVFPDEDCSELTRKKLQELRDAKCGRGLGAATIKEPPSQAIILDGLLGLGSKELLRE